MKDRFLLFLTLLLFGCAEPADIDHQFTIAVIPDTQNYVDYRHQPEEGFVVDGGAMFLAQLQYIADNATSNGGEVEFATSVGDVWDQVDIGIDPEHAKRGLSNLPLPEGLNTTRRMRGRDEVEIPLVQEAYDLLAAADLKFSVVPGNHDFDWTWFDSNFPRDLDRRDEIRDADGWYSVLDPTILGMLHYGGYQTYNSVFGPESGFFKDKSWYVGSFNGGANSAQVFDAGGYKFLHLAFEMQAGAAVINWAQSVIEQNKGLPTIITTHDFLNQQGERKAEMNMDLARVDPDQHLGAEEIWQDFISKNDQIFMILSGHYRGAASRVDKNDFGNNVYQLLSNYQGRGQVENPPEGKRPGGVGDGWLRLMEFDTGLDVPTIKVRTYSTHYKKYSHEIPQYAKWYKRWEHEELSDEEFRVKDHFTIELGGFKKRFGEPK